MTLSRVVKTFLKDPEPTAIYSEVVPGLNIVEGIVRIENPLRSPVRGQNCAAFFYRSFLIIGGGRSPAPVFHKIKEARVYACFELDMEGGSLSVVPKKPGAFEQRDHLELARRYGKEFQGVEEVVLPGARVRLRGSVKKRNDQLVLHLKEISVIDKQAVTSGVQGSRKKRRKRKE